MIKSMTAMLFASTLFLSSCMKDNDHNEGIETQVSGLMAFNLSPGPNGVNFALSGSALTNTPLSYTNYTGNYLGIYPGSRTVDVYNASGSTVLASTPASFEAQKYYSTFLIGKDSSYRALVVTDEIDSLSGASGQAYVRYVNAIPDSVNVPTITIAAGGTNVVSGPATYGSVSAFTAVSPGDLAVTLSNEGSINVSRNIPVESRKIYTLLLVGNPGSADAPVAIRFISNGTISADSTGRTSSAGRSVLAN